MPGERVEFASNGSKGQGYLATPATSGGSAVIVIQEWWGLVAHIKAVADRFASAGFVALAPDLYHGETARKPDEAGRLMLALDIERALGAAGAAVDFHIYPDAEHAFFNDTRADVYHPEAASDAWTRTLAFLHENLA